MTSEKDRQETQKQRRNARLAEQLRTNLQRRKGQARARRTGEADKRQGIDPAAGSDPSPSEKG
ncbi:hypothetical protein [Mesorhizobium xinjiangense]|uniref:hypothetical protein n=1 Tax=Mesorhizobium xinjiangense TaxID=2678685 RepID=UPI0012EDC9F2|nr:hypothetical protein [Mesorhizobium xinjiangense]